MKGITAVGEELLEDGFKPPFRMVQISSNGVLFYYLFRDQGELGFGPEILAVYPDGPAQLKAPVTQFWIDADGMTRIIIEPGPDVPDWLSLSKTRKG